MSDIDLEKIIKAANEKKKNRIICFNKILEMILNKIKLVAKTDETKVWYMVPKFLLGYASFKIDDCCDYLVKKIKKKGFKCELYKPNLLYVNWDL